MKYAVILIIFGLISCNPKEETTSQPESEPLTLIYLSSRGNGFDLYKKVIGDSIDVKITNNPGWDWNPQPILGGFLIQNSTDTVGGFSMRKIDSNGNSLPFDLKDLTEVTIAPDGNNLVYSRQNGDFNYLMHAPLDRLADSISFTENNSYNGRAKWSPNSEKIAFISDRTGSNEIFIYSTEDRSTIRLTQNNLREKYMAWGPDGENLITSMQTDSTENDLFMINLNSLEVTRITETPNIHESEITWSPDGRYIAYHAKVETKDDIFLLDLRTKSITKITESEGYHGEPVFLLN